MTSPRRVHVRRADTGEEIYYTTRDLLAEVQRLQRLGWRVRPHPDVRCIFVTGHRSTHVRRLVFGEQSQLFPESSHD